MLYPAKSDSAKNLFDIILSSIFIRIYIQKYLLCIVAHNYTLRRKLDSRAVYPKWITVMASCPWKDKETIIDSYSINKALPIRRKDKICLVVLLKCYWSVFTQDS